jgi:xanthine dehydrogenase YagS FAD-binding subunit
MNNFEYANPTTLKDALPLLGSAWGEADVLAGGTDLISLMKDEIHKPKRVVNIKGIKELQGVGKAKEGGTRIGAVVTFDELLDNPGIRNEYPALVQAVRGVSSPQIRNMGTVGGDLLQRPRCWYFRQGHGVLAQMNGKSLVPQGENRYHAIFPKGDAYFVSASSLAPALIALGAKVKLVSAAGPRELPVEQLFVAPASNTERETAIKPNEILTEIVIPAARGIKSATYEVREKQALDWPLATASVAVGGGKTRIVLGHVGPTPVVASAAEQLIGSQAITADLAEKAGAAAVQGAQPLSQNDYKVQLAKVAVKRALLSAAGLA